VGTVDRVPSLEANDSTPAASTKQFARFSRSESIFEEIIVRRKIHNIKGATKRHISPLRKSGHTRVGEIIGPVYLNSFVGFVNPVSRLDTQDSEKCLRFIVKCNLVALA
jgi:hypothetical protein